ncbi:YybH family protein [Nesterenkonia muleiensis]|uniref:YybH family protein n=1 Tax=Nesterenkonia muleiensis TaxID=2282648 RepID=UPI000E749324|nr:nuclear transport factor 2 family protein [Nesterenkonia muleiensis]
MSPSETGSARETFDALLSATNTHDFDNVTDLLHEGVSYFFNDATLTGHKLVRRYFEDTWEAIQDEEYWAEEPQWLVENTNTAVVVYRYRWKGIIDGKPSQGSGRATNVFVRNEDGKWQMAHEHLSGEP